MGEFRRRFGLSRSECDWLLSEGRVVKTMVRTKFGLTYWAVPMTEVRRYIRVMARPPADRWVEIPSRDMGLPEG